MTKQVPFAVIVSKLQNQILSLIATEADLAGEHPETLRKAVLEAIAADVSPDFRDGRAAPWRVRVRLYDAKDLTTAEADTDPELPGTEPGATEMYGLPRAATFAAETATRYHNAACAGLQPAALNRKVSSLRTQLSNGKKDSGWFNADYSVIEFHGHEQRPRQMTLRCDVTRATAVEPARRMPGT